MNMPAEEVLRLIGLNEFEHRAAAGVQSFLDAVEPGSKRRSVADQDQPFNAGELTEALGDLLFGVLAWRLKRRGTGIAECAELAAAFFEQLVMNIPQAELVAEGGHLFRRFVIAGNCPDFARFLAQDFSTAIESPAPVHQIARGDVVIRLGLNQLPERPEIVVNIGKEQHPHEARLYYA